MSESTSGSSNAVRRPSGFREDLHNYRAHLEQSFKEARDAQEVLIQRYEEARRSRERRNTEIGRTAAGTRVEVGNLILVKETTPCWRGKGCISYSPTSTGYDRDR